MTTPAVIVAALLMLAAAVAGWLKVLGLLPGVDVWLLRRRIRRSEDACRRGEDMCAICASVFVRDLFAEDVRREEER